MVRAAAKNFKNVVILSDPSNYEQFVNEIQKQDKFQLKLENCLQQKLLRLLLIMKV